MLANAWKRASWRIRSRLNLGEGKGHPGVHVRSSEEARKVFVLCGFQGDPEGGGLCCIALQMHGDALCVSEHGSKG